MRPVLSCIAALMLAVSLSGCDPRVWVFCSSLGTCRTNAQVPETPRDVQAAPYSGTVVITWAPRRDQDQTEDGRLFFRTSHYAVYRAAEGGEFAEIARDLPGEATSYEDRDAENGTRYRYYVVAYSDPASPPSIEVSATPRAGLPPHPPQGLNAAAAGGSIGIGWSPSFTADEYHVHRSEVAGGPYERIASTRVPTFSDSGIVAGRTYHYVVTAENRFHEQSGASSEATATVPAPTGSNFGFLFSFGHLGRHLVDVATDAAGTVYVLDEIEAQVERYNHRGEHQGAFGRTGQVCEGRLGDPQGLGSDAAGNVYVTDAEAECVQKFDANGAWERSFGSPGNDDGEFIAPGDVAIDPAGDVYVVDRVDDRVQKFDSDGTFITKWGSQGAGDGQFLDPSGIAADAAGNVYVTDRVLHRVQRFSSTGLLRGMWGSEGDGAGQFRGPSDVATDAAGFVYVSEFARVQRFAADGTPLAQFGVGEPVAGQLHDTQGIAIDCRTNVYVVDINHPRIKKFGDPAAPAPPCGMSGSAPGAAARRVRSVRPSARAGFEARFSSSSGSAGTVRRPGGRLVEKGARQRGTFTLKPVGRGARRAGLPTRRFSRGTWHAVFDVDAGLRALTGSVSGTALATSRNRRGGRLCLDFKIKMRITTRLDLTGTFRTLGGTRDGARLVARGSYSQRAAGRRWVIRGTSSARPGRLKPMPARCRRVARVFGLR